MKMACLYLFSAARHTQSSSATRMARSDARKRFTPLLVASSAPPLLAQHLLLVRTTSILDADA